MRFAASSRDCRAFASAFARVGNSFVSPFFCFMVDEQFPPYPLKTVQTM
jgi:hypothetical protein